MKTDKIITQYLTDVSNIHSVSSYVEIYKDTLQNIDLTVKNEILEPQLNNYCGSLENAIERILEYIKTHNVDNESYFVLAKRINILLSDFQNIMIKKGFKIENGFENEEIKHMYKRIALRVEPNIEKKYLPHAYELEKEFKRRIEIEAVEQKETEVKENVLEPKKFLFSNEFDKVNEELIYNHFYKNLVDTGYLTNKELETFLTEAFHKKNIPNLKFDLKNIPNKKTIINIFYSYFKLAQKPHGKKEQYVKLLTDYFNGYKYENTLTNFAKHYY